MLASAPSDPRTLALCCSAVRDLSKNCKVSELKRLCKLFAPATTPAMPMPRTQQSSARGGTTAPLRGSAYCSSGDAAARSPRRPIAAGGHQRRAGRRVRGGRRGPRAIASTAGPRPRSLSLSRERDRRLVQAGAIPVVGEAAQKHGRSCCASASTLERSDDLKTEVDVVAIGAQERPRDPRRGRCLRHREFRQARRSGSRDVCGRWNATLVRRRARRRRGPRQRHGGAARLGQSRCRRHAALARPRQARLWRARGVSGRARAHSQPA